MGLYEYEKPETIEIIKESIEKIEKTISEEEKKIIDIKIIKYSDVIQELKEKIKDRFISD